MDQQKSVQSAHTTPVPAKQNDFTKWIIVTLLLIATIGTGSTYLLFTNPQVKQLVYKVASPSPSPSPSEDMVSANEETMKTLHAWKKYTNTQHNYSFVYYGTWRESPASKNVDFVLQHVSKTDPGIIEGSFLPPDTRTETYCEQNRGDTDRCTIYPITANREIILDMTDYVETGKISLMIIHPKNGTILINITDANFDSYTLMNFISSTLQFTDEELINKFQFCPDSWSEDKQIAFVKELSFDPKDFNEQCRQE